MLCSSVCQATNIGQVRNLKHWHRIYDETQGFQHVEYFYTDWCVYCPQQTRIIEELAKENRHVIFMKINADILKRPQVTSYPTVLIGGRHFSGVTPKSVLQSLIKPRKVNPQALSVKPQPIPAR